MQPANVRRGGEIGLEQDLQGEKTATRIEQKWLPAY